MENNPNSAQIIKQVNDLEPNVRAYFLGQLGTSLASNDDKKHLATSSINATEGEAKAEVITEGAKTLPEKAQQTLSNVLEGPSPEIRDQIWKIVIWAFVILIVGSFLTLTISLFLPTGTATDARVQIILTVFTTAAAFLTGLLAPSPMSSKQGS